jgi:hypothetical protein
LLSAGELPSRRKASKRQTSRAEETAATSQAAAIAAVAASSGANYLDAAARTSDHNIALQPPSSAEAKGAAQGPSSVSRSFLDPLGVFEKVSAQEKLLVDSTMVANKQAWEEGTLGR